MLRNLRRKLSRESAEPKRWMRVTKNHYLKGRPTPNAANRGKFLIARIMGNDLYPRHGQGQMLANLRFILENEADFDDCTKLFVLNKIFDPARQAEAEELVKSHGANSLILPFKPEEYAATGWDVETFGGVGFFASEAFHQNPRPVQDRMRIWAFGPKIRYAMNINGARNAAIEAGQKLAEWTIPLDGNCIFTTASFERLKNDCLSDPFAPYVIIPMHRLEDNAGFESGEPDPRSPEEPQIALHESAREGFDEAFPYGLRDKTVLLKSLGVPGEWQKWLKQDWLPEDDQDIPDKHFYKFTTGGVFRLSSGGGGFEQANAQHKRYTARNQSILSTVSQLNKIHGTKDPEIEAILMGDVLPGSVVSYSPPTSADQGHQFQRKKPMPAIAQYDVKPDIKRLEGRTLFIGLGAMKAGTSWVSDYLRESPEVYHSPIKEMNFFNQLDRNPLSSYGERFRQARMREILLKKNWDYPPRPENYETLKALAELGTIKTEDDYLSFFARRIGDQTHFGEICPQYSLVPPKTYRRMESMGLDTRLMFFMRDPTDRLASNIQHSLRNNSFDIDDAIEKLTAKENWYQRSDYIVTIENFRKSGTSLKFQTFVYEDLFTNESVMQLCNFLGIEFMKPDFKKQVNVARGPKISSGQKARIREKLDPLYRQLADFFGDEKPAKWRW